MTESFSRSEALRWLERALLAIGAALAVWSALTVAQTWFFSTLPVPPPRTTIARLPGEEPSVTVSRGSPAAAHTTLRTGDWIARLEIPRIALSATVLEGSDDATLNRAAGHIEDTALPGTAGNAGIAAHRDTIFRPVRNLRVGDVMTVTTADGVYDYRVDRTLIVNPEDVYVLDPTDRATLTLVTCYPFTFIGHAPQRFIVKASLVAERPR
jgi:sortase A